MTPRLIAGLGAAICCWWSARRLTGAQRTWRLLLAPGLLGWTTGQAIRSWYELARDTSLPAPSVADAGNLILPVLAVAALLAVATGDRPSGGTPPRAHSRWSRPALLLDGLVVVGALAFLSWSTVLGAAVRAGAPTALAFGVNVAYPLSGLILVVLVVLLLASPRVATGHRSQLTILGLGLAGLAVSGSVVASAGTSAVPPVATAGFIAGPALIAVAALAGGAPRSAGTPSRSHLLLPYLPLVAAAVLVAIRTATAHGPHAVEIYVAVLIIGLVVLRLLIALVENTALLERIAESQRRLAFQPFHAPFTGLGGTTAYPDLANLLAAALRGDPSGGVIDVHYQPIVRMSDRTPVAVEALARWTSPSLGSVPADVFVAAAERAGLVAELDNLVLDRACREVAALAAEHGSALGVHVNVSAGRLSCPFLETIVRDTLRRHGLPGHRLVLEITETSRIPDLDAAAAMTRRLRALGVRLALDDFGTGYNTLAHLHALQVDVVKLDQALTVADGDAGRTDALGRSVVSISQALGMSVIAEGVETTAQAGTLAAWGCGLGQGYLYGRSGPLGALVHQPATVP